MRSVVSIEPGVVELNYTWLPTWIGMHGPLKADIEEAIAKEFVGRALTEETLDEMHNKVLDYLVTKYSSIKGLRAYLEAMSFVEDRK